MFDFLDMIIGGSINAVGGVLGATVRVAGAAGDLAVDATFGNAERIITPTLSIADRTVGGVLNVTGATIDAGVRYVMPAIAIGGQSYLTGVGLAAASQIGGPVGDAVRTLKVLGDTYEPFSVFRDYLGMTTREEPGSGT